MQLVGGVPSDQSRWTAGSPGRFRSGRGATSDSLVGSELVSQQLYGHDPVSDVIIRVGAHDQGTLSGTGYRERVRETL